MDGWKGNRILRVLSSIVTLVLLEVFEGVSEFLRCLSIS